MCAAARETVSARDSVHVVGPFGCWPLPLSTSFLSRSSPLPVPSRALFPSLRLCSQGQYFFVDASVPAGVARPPSAPRNVEAASGRLLSPSQLSTLVHALRSASLAAPGAVESGQSGYRLVPARCVVDVIDRLASGGKLPSDWVRLGPGSLWSFVRSFQASADLVDWQALCCALVVTGRPSALGVSGAVPGGCAWRGMSPEEAKASLEEFARLDLAGEGCVPIAECASIQFWFEGDGVGGPLDAVVPTASVHQQGMATFAYPFSKDGWHGVTLDHPSSVAWRQAEAAATSHVAAIARQCAEVAVRAGRGCHRVTLLCCCCIALALTCHFVSSLRPSPSPLPTPPPPPHSRTLLPFFAGRQPCASTDWRVSCKCLVTPASRHFVRLRGRHDLISVPLPTHS